MNHSTPCPPLPPATSRNGSALVIVLVMLVLITIVVVSFFISVSTERGESSAAENQTAARNLATTTVDLVKSTISQATSGYESDATGTLDRGKIVSWASQPGMIHTWKQNGDPEKTYRLYSSGDMVTTGALDPKQEADAITGWKLNAGSYNALWCDLNAPAEGKNGVRSYPIMTPPALLDAAAGVPTDDPSTPGLEGVQGFSIDKSPGYVSADAASAKNNPAPMPVKWLYVLKDGRFVTPAAGGKPTEVKVTGATTDNPIVGRVAYWTDDETAKVNLNTASEGNFWSVPVGAYLNEGYLGRYQPSRNEFQRYPGHPAATSLSAVLPSLSPPSEDTFQLFPRTEWGGSLNGTRSPVLPCLAINTERLYTSVDEAIFKAAESPRVKQSVVTPDQIARARFFLTTASRAPEETLFNTPRISMWPINTGSATTTTTEPSSASDTATVRRQDGFDKTLRFCSTIGSKAYYFARANNLSPTFDAAIPRNETLFKYLQDITSRDIPGYGGSFAGKYTVPHRDALLTQTFDFIRSGACLVRVSDMLPSGKVKSGYTVQASNENSGSLVDSTFSRLVVPIRIGTHKGMGNFLGITQAGLLFYAENVEVLNAAGNAFAVNAADPNAKLAAAPDPIVPVGKAKRIRYTIRPLLMVETFCPTVGWSRAPRLVNGTTGNTVHPAIRMTATGTGLSLQANAAASNGSGSGEIDMPWGKVAELNITPDGTIYQESLYAMYAPGPFLFNNPTSIGNVMKGDMQFAPGDDYRGYCYRGQPIVLTYDLPSQWTDNVDDDERRLSRFQSAMTSKAEAPDMSESVAGDDAVLASYRASWAPRMTLSGGSLTIKLGFAASGAALNDSEVIQTATVTLPQMNALPVPSQTYSLRPKTSSFSYKNYKTKPLWNTAAYAAGSLLDIQKAVASDYMSRFPKPSSLNYLNSGSSYLIQPGDVVRSLQLTGTSGSNGDWRLAFLQQNVAASWFDDPAAPGMANWGLNSDRHHVHSHGQSLNSQGAHAPGAAQLVAGLPYYGLNQFSGTNELKMRGTSANLAGAKMANGAPGDWSNQIADDPDGAQFTMPEAPALGRSTDIGGGKNGDVHWSYYTLKDISDTRVTDGILNADQFHIMYSPNREMYSSMQLGTLLTQADESSPKPWQTLLFCPNSASTIAGQPHPGEASPPDHLFADLFWMPSVDPYPISERLSTAGKINLNYQIAPFTYIRRATSQFALMKAMKITALSDSYATGTGANYKVGGASSIESAPTKTTRYPIAIEETLKAFDQMFSQGQVFRSATALAERFLYPAGPSGSPLVSYDANETAIRGWWADKRLTGDNYREDPYAQLYPRTTTKSNTFTVHYRVQGLKKVPGPDPGLWTEGHDAVESEYRGSTTIERYIDPNDATLPDFADSANYGKSLGTHYRWRTVLDKQFTP